MRPDNSKGCRATAIAIVVAVGAAIVTPGFGEYEIPWWTIDGGGGTSTGGPYSLTGTIGQPDADWSEGGSYELLGGFWPGGPLCIVEFDDFARFAEHWLESTEGADLNEDHVLDFLDVQKFSDYWLTYCPYGWQLR